jgi:hypothetical protein
LCSLKFCGLANGQQGRVLVVFRPDSVDQPVCLEDIFLAEDFLSFLVLSVRAEDFACDRFAALFCVTAERGIHL